MLCHNILLRVFLDTPIVDHGSNISQIFETLFDGIGITVGLCRSHVGDVLGVVAGDEKDGILALAVAFELVSEFADSAVEVGNLGAVERPENLEVAIVNFDRARDVISSV